jgi:hypothetical protein
MWYVLHSECCIVSYCILWTGARGWSSRWDKYGRHRCGWISLETGLIQSGVYCKLIYNCNSYQVQQLRASWGRSCSRLLTKGRMPSHGGPNSGWRERERERAWTPDLLKYLYRTTGRVPLWCISKYGLYFVGGGGGVLWTLLPLLESALVCWASGTPYWPLYSCKVRLHFNRLCFGPQISKVLFGLTVTNLVLHQYRYHNTMNKFPFIQCPLTTPTYTKSASPEIPQVSNRALFPCEGQTTSHDKSSRWKGKL